VLSVPTREERNLPDDASEVAGIKTDGPNLGVTFIDYDHDGDLDFTSSQHYSRTRPRPPQWADNQVSERPNFSLQLQVCVTIGNGTFH